MSSTQPISDPPEPPTFEHYGPAYRLGCPMWANRAWLGSLFTGKAKAADFLTQYGRVFQTVEGNTTFYGLPKPETVQQWLERTPNTFRFCFKFPRSISHDAQLFNCERERDAFLERMSPLGERLGPFFLQLPPHFGKFQVLERFLARLPNEWRYAVELRHPSFFDQGTQERDTRALLEYLDIDWVVFDTRRLHALEHPAPEVRASQRKKPKAPVRFQATGHHPFIRFVGNPDIQADLDILRDWAERVANWIKAGKQPFVFIHHVPDDDDAPQLARLFHGLLREQLPGLAAMAPWSGELEAERQRQQENQGPTQLSLF